MTSSDRPERVPSGATPEGDGIMLGTGPVRVDAYIDFLCPFCRRFENSCGPELSRLLDEQAITLVYHPMNFLDEASTTAYSTRAAAASGCAADRGAFLPYLRALYANQPPEGGPGLSDSQLAGLAGDAGLDPRDFGECLAAGAYLKWPSYVTARAAEARVEATPTIFIGGEDVPPEPKAIADAVARAAR
jgi:protein-disulfide isomerase